MIGVKQIVIGEELQGRVLDMNEIDKSYPDYYLIDAENDVWCTAHTLPASKEVKFPS